MIGLVVAYLPDDLSIEQTGHTPKSLLVCLPAWVSD